MRMRKCSEGCKGSIIGRINRFFTRFMNEEHVLCFKERWEWLRICDHIHNTIVRGRQLTYNLHDMLNFFNFGIIVCKSLR